KGFVSTAEQSALRTTAFEANLPRCRSIQPPWPEIDETPKLRTPARLRWLRRGLFGRAAAVDRCGNAPCFIVRDHDGQGLAFVYCEDEPGRRAAAKLLTRYKVRRIAGALTRLPELQDLTHRGGCSAVMIGVECTGVALAPLDVP